MGSSANRLRAKWQDYTQRNADSAEINFFEVFNILFEGTEYTIRKKPKEFNKIYVNVELDDDVKLQIYIPDKEITKHGVVPDYAIDNYDTKKTIYVEVKRQDGWVEGKKRTAGRGNAHERSCKYFTPGLIKIMREKGNIVDNYLPFWTVFQGDITRDPCRVREITFWYGKYIANYFFWRNAADKKPLIEHFINYIKPIIG